MTITVPAISTAANGMTFLAAVNRMLRIQGFIRGDTDPLTSFSDTSHNSTSQLAQIAVQQELTELQSRQLIPAMHKITGVITLATNVRSYALPADFIQFWGDPPFFYDSSANYQVGPYPGGENRLRQEIMDYRTAPGYPLWFYNELSVARQISFYPVPDAPRDGLVLTYDYGASVQVTYSTDTLPFQNDQQSQAFVDCAEIGRAHV